MIDLRVIMYTTSYPSQLLEVTLQRCGREVVAETAQMRKRIKHFTLQWQIPEEKREEVLRVCAHCTARLYLEGKPLLDSPSAPAQGVPALPAAPSSSSDAPLAKRRRTAAECVRELHDLKALLDCGVLLQQEFIDMKGRLLRGD